MTSRQRILPVVLLLSGGVALLAIQTALGPGWGGEVEQAAARSAAAARCQAQPEPCARPPLPSPLEPEARVAVISLVHGPAERARLLGEEIREPDACGPRDPDLLCRNRERLPLLDVIEACSSADARVALAAREVLEQDSSAAARLKHLLASASQRDAQDVCLAIEGIRHFPGEDFQEELRRLAVQGQEAPIRRLAVEALAGGARDVLLAALADPDWSVRHAALCTAPGGKALDAELAEALSDLLADANPIVRAGARRLLSSF